jgi:putative NADPH-quinone reductase
MPRRIVVIQGHPDPDPGRFCRALAAAYAEAAEQAGHEIRRIEVAELDFPILRTAEDFQSGTAPDVIRQCQEAIGWAEHLLIVYPLWLGSMPALLKAFLEQVFRPGFATAGDATRGTWQKLLIGKSARIVVTMGMPAFVYRWFPGAQPEEPGAQHPRLLRHRPDQGDPDRHGRGKERCQAPSRPAENARARPGGPLAPGRRALPALA